MSTAVGVTAVAMCGVGLVAIENVSKGHDPFPQLMVGGLFVAGTAFIAEVNTDFAMGIAVVFLTSTFLLHSSTITDLMTKFASPQVGRGAKNMKRTNTAAASTVSA